MPIVPLIAAALAAGTPLPSSTVGAAVAADMPQLMTLYRDLHQHPELSMQEVRSPTLLAAAARKLTR